MLWASDNVIEAFDAAQSDQKPGTSYPKDSPITDSTTSLMRMGKPVGAFGGSKDFILRFRNGELVAADTGDQGGGQIKKKKAVSTAFPFFVVRFENQVTFFRHVAPRRIIGKSDSP
jgi:hypothetical protein